MEFQLDQVSSKKVSPDNTTSTTNNQHRADHSNAILNKKITALIQHQNSQSLRQSADSLSRIGGRLAIYCNADLENKFITEAAAMATLYKGYESLLPGRDLKQVGLVSSTASGICGGVHATASALCLEMALGLKPPPLGIVLRNLLLSCQYLNDNTMHLFVLAGPDYSEAVFARSNPEIWNKATQSICQFQSSHGYHRISDIMTDLNKGTGKLYQEALRMVSIARKAYIILGGKYPHSESIIAGGVAITADAEKLKLFKSTLESFAAYSQKTAAIWDDLFNFLLDVQPRYESLGKSSATMLDFGQWDHPDHYDASYEYCDHWGQNRWSTPGLIIDGKLQCDRLSLLNAGLEECLDYSYQTSENINSEQLIHHDPLGNPISARHPWNKRSGKPQITKPDAYSWGSSLTWCGHGFEVGAYSRLYLTAIAQHLPDSQHLAATGNSLDFLLPIKSSSMKNSELSWKIPLVWNAFERNRARAYALAFNYSVTLENINIAMQLLQKGDRQTHVQLPQSLQSNSDEQLGIGLWGASRGFLAHWAVIKEQTIDNYQISIPSRVNMGTRSSTKSFSPIERALINTPIIESGFSNVTDFSAIDIQRTIQSFDPCMSCSAHVLINHTDEVIDREIETGFPI